MPFFFMGVAHLDPWGDTRRPGYSGSLMTPVEKMQLADRVSGSKHKNPVTTDHGSFAGYGYDPVALGEAVGYNDMVFVDKYGKVHTAGMIPSEFGVARQIVDDIKAGGKWGLSFVTDMMLRGNPEHKIVDSLNITSLGVTKNPAWGNEGTWIHEWSEDEVAFRQMLRDRYLSQVGMYVPAAARERLAQFEAQDRLILAERARQRNAASLSNRHLHRAATFAMSDTAAASLPVASEPAVVAAAAAAPAVVVTASADEADRLRTKLFTDHEAIKRVQNPMKRYELVDLFNEQLHAVSKHLPVRQLAQLGPLFDFVDTERELIQGTTQQHMRSLVQEEALSKEAADFVYGMMKGPMDDPNKRLVCEAIAASANTSVKNQKHWETTRRDAADIVTENATLKRKHEETTGELEGLKKRMLELEQRNVNPLSAALAAVSAQETAAAAAARPASTPVSVAASSGAASLGGNNAAAEFARMFRDVKPASVASSRTYEAIHFSRTNEENGRKGSFVNYGVDTVRPFGY